MRVSSLPKGSPDQDGNERAAAAAEEEESKEEESAGSVLTEEWAESWGKSPTDLAPRRVGAKSSGRVAAVLAEEHHDAPEVERAL
jgi:hypothetical protein